MTLDYYPPLSPDLNSDGVGLLGAAINQRKNLLQNGAFNVWQRGTTFTDAGTAYYGPDRWAGFTGTVGRSTVSRQLAGLTGFEYCARLARSAVDVLTNSIYLATALESIDCYLVAGLPLTLSFWARCGAGFASLNLFPGAKACEFSVQYGLGVDQGPFAAFSNYICRAFFTPTTVWTKYQITGLNPAAATQIKAYTSWQPTAVAGANNYLEITGLQLEVGTAASPFEVLPFNIELALCSRYYQKSFPYATAPATNVGVTNGTLSYTTVVAGLSNTYVQCLLTPRMRIAPTVAFYNPLAANTNWRSTVARIADSGVASLQGTSDENSFIAKNPQVAADITKELVRVHWTADAEL